MKSLKSQPLISVVIPSYNHAGFVREAINSVLTQTYSRIELIIVDDGSTDGSLDIIEQTLKAALLKYRNVSSIFLKQSNQGAHHAINTGLSIASGKYLTILNSDDYYFKTRLETLEKIISKSDTEFIFTYVQHVDAFGKNIEPNHIMKRWYRRDITKNFPSLGFRILWSNLAVTTGNFFFTKKLYQAIGGFKNYKVVHDYDFLLRSLFYCEPILVKKYLMAYRVHEENTITTNANLSAIEGPLIAYDFFKNSIANPLPRNKKAPCKAYWNEIYSNFWKDEASSLSYWIGRQNPTDFF